MLQKYKYDTSFSVAEEDLSVAEMIAAELKKRRIRYYLYTEHEVENTGKTILQVMLEVYKKRSRFVLMITGRIFVQKYWAGIEAQIVQMASAKRQDYIIWLKLDDTPVDGLSRHIISLQWANNPEKIADIIEGKIKNNKQKLLIKHISVLIILSAACIISFYFTSQIKKEKTNPVKDEKIKLTIGSIIDGDEYLSWVKREFEKKYPQYEVIYIPKVGGIKTNKTAPNLFDDLYMNTDIQLFLGGHKDLHEQKREGLGNIAHIIQENRDNVSSYDSGKKWIGYYQNYLGSVWNKEKTDSGFVIRSVKDLEKFPKPSKILVPNPAESSAAQDFLLALGVQIDGFDMNIAMTRYRNFLNCSKTLKPKSSQATKIVAKLDSLVAVEWPHDAAAMLWDYRCIGISIFDESIPSIGCISVRDGQEENPGIIAFINFVLSPYSQLQHFTIAYRLPINEKLFNECLIKLKKDGKLSYFPEKILSNKYYVPKFDLKKYTDSLTKYDVLYLTQVQIEYIKLSGCN